MVAVVFAAAFLTAPFFRAVFLAGFAFAASARFNAQRFLSAATIAAFPALLSFRFGFDDSGVSGAVGADSPRVFALLAFCAIAILRLEAAENFLRLRLVGSGVATGSVVPPGSMALSSAILPSMRVFCDS